MKSYKIKNLLLDIFSGDWGEDSNNSEGIKVIRTTNFIEFGRLSFANVVSRKIKTSAAQRKMLMSGDIIIERSGGSPTQPVGRVAFFNVPELTLEIDVKKKDEVFICNNFCSVLRPNSNIVDPEYLFHYMRNFHLQGKTRKFQNKTVGIINLKLQDYLEQEISIHQNLAEQKIIVKLINEAEELIYKRRKSILLLDDFLKNEFLEIFGDPVSNKKTWKQVILSELGSLDRGVSKNRPRNAPELLGGKYPLIQTGEVSNAGLYIKTFTQTYSEIGLKQSKLWKKGTMLITIAANIAQTSILTFDACFPDSIVGFTAKKKKSNPIYVHFLFRFFQKNLEKNAPQAAQKNINLQLLRNLQVPAPPIALQNNFARIVEQTEKLRLQFDNSLKEIESLYNSISHRSFKDELNFDRIALEHIIPKGLNDKTVDKNLVVVSKVEHNKIVNKRELALKSITNKHFKDKYFTYQELAEKIQENLGEEEYNYDKIKKQIFEALRGKGDIHLKQFFNEETKMLLLRSTK